ncbi:MAG: hypothetical protein ACI4VM_02130, partial [Anaerovoracaceae bacterium]
SPFLKLPRSLIWRAVSTQRFPGFSRTGIYCSETAQIASWYTLRSGAGAGFYAIDNYFYELIYDLFSAIREPLWASRPVLFPPDNAYYTQVIP